MPKHGKRYQVAAAKIERDRQYHPTDAMNLVKETTTVSYDPTVDLAVRLGVDPRKADQMVRGTVALPSGTGKDVRVAVFAAAGLARCSSSSTARKLSSSACGANDALPSGTWTLP